MATQIRWDDEGHMSAHHCIRISGPFSHPRIVRGEQGRGEETINTV